MSTGVIWGFIALNICSATHVISMGERDWNSSYSTGSSQQKAPRQLFLGGPFLRVIWGGLEGVIC